MPYDCWWFLGLGRGFAGVIVGSVSTDISFPLGRGESEYKATGCAQTVGAVAKMNAGGRRPLELLPHYNKGKGVMAQSGQSV